MGNHLIFWPVLGHIMLVLALYAVLMVRKKAAAAQNLVNEDRRALFDDAWPETVVQVNNCIRNQFEVPMLFYALSFVLWAVDAINYVTIALAWAFLMTRISHAVVHTGSNYVPLRRPLFTLGVVLLLIMLGFTMTALYS